MRVGVHQPHVCSSQTLSRHRGAFRPPLSPGMLRRDGPVHVALGMVDTTRHFLMSESFLGYLIGTDLPVATRRLSATIGVLGTQFVKQGRGLLHCADLILWLLLYFLAVVILIQ